MMLPFVTLGGIGEMFFEPGAIVTQAHSIQRRRERGTDSVDLMARVAMVGLIDHRALRHEIRRGQQRRLVLRRERQDEQRKRIQVGGAQIHRWHRAAWNNLRWILEVRHQPSNVAMAGRNLGEIRADAFLPRSRMAAQCSLAS